MLVLFSDFGFTAISWQTPERCPGIIDEDVSLKFYGNINPVKVIFYYQVTFW